MSWLGLKLGRPEPQRQRMTYRDYEEVLQTVAKCAVTMDRTPEPPDIDTMLAGWTEWEEGQ